MEELRSLRGSHEAELNDLGEKLRTFHEAVVAAQEQIRMLEGRGGIRETIAQEVAGTLSELQDAYGRLNKEIQALEEFPQNPN
jgi:uncharacterized protein involved in exopolysaccharide biosynthesis